MEGLKNGLSSQEAKLRLAQHGYNELPSAKPKNIYRIALEVFKEPMFLLLIGCGILYMLLGDYKEGIVLVSTILIIISITFFQYRKTEKALDALKKYASPRTLVIRDGIEQRIPGREVVNGDCIILNEGDRVPADAFLLDTHHLVIDESILTGESVSVNKDASPDQTPNVFSGTLVVSGKGTAIVTHTGIHTMFGKIGVSLGEIESDETRLQKEMKLLIRNLFIIGACISSIIIVFYYFGGTPIIQSILNGLSSAMAILPEEFPVVLTVFLALGAWRLSKKNVLTRKATAIETLGSATVLCSDKTGTITQNKMEVVIGYHDGNVYKKEAFKNNSAIGKLLHLAHLASQENSIDPMEKAFTEAHLFHNENHQSLSFIQEYPFSRELMAMTRVYRSENNKLIIATKGAPETVFDFCKLSLEEKKQLEEKVVELATQGYRVLAIAEGIQASESLPEKQSGFSFTFSGLLGLQDPIRPEVPQAIQECREAGIQVIMITGDYPATAKSIAQEIGLDENGLIVTGTELNNWSDNDLMDKIKSITVFARVIPEQKLRIVQCLKKKGEIVAMTGDGVNDAPALKAADIGIAMGNKGTDVAREASSLVLLDDNFASIVGAIRLGRKIFDNLQKAMSYIIAIHIPIIGLTLIPAFFHSAPLMLFPLHIVFMELIIDPVCSVVFEAEQEERGIMKRKPRKPDELFFGFKKIISSSLQGILLLLMVLAVYWVNRNEGHNENETRSMVFSALIIGNVFLILSNLSKTRSSIAVLFEGNKSLLVLLPLALGLLALITFVPQLQDLFNFEYAGYTHYFHSIAGAFTLLMILETIKFIRYRKEYFS